MTPTTVFQRCATALCVFAAALLTACATSAILQGTAWLAPLAAVVAAIVASGLVFRSLPGIGTSGLAALVEFCVSAWAVLIACAPGAMLGGVVPTPAAFGELFALLGQGIDDIYSTTAPAPATPGLLALMTVGLALVTTLVDGLVADLRAPKTAGIILLVVYLVPALLAPRELRWWHFASIGAAFLLLLLTPYAERGPSRGPLTAAAAGALALLLGVGIPLLIPPIEATHTRPLTAPKDLTVVNPFLDLKSDLSERSKTPIISYSTQDPLAPPIRLTSVSDYDGRTWKPETFKLDTAARANGVMPGAPGLSGDAERRTYTASFSIGGLDQQYLPAPYAPQTAHGVSDQWIYDSDTLTIVGNGITARDQQYEVSYTSVEPTAAQLAAAAPVDASQFSAQLSMPNDSPAIIARTAKRETKGAANEWEKAAKLQAYLRSDAFSYSLNAPKQASGDAIADFLADKRGYCVQFSGAMAAMARTLGIPARIGVGFTPGEQTGQGRYDVSMSQSHAWPELYFSGVGWVRFEPTPGGPAGAPPPWTEEGGESAEEPTASASPTPEDTSSASAEPITAEPSSAPAEEDEGAPAAGAGAGFPWWIALLVLAVLLVLALPLAVRALQRSRRLRAPQDPEAVWAEVRSSLVDGGALGPASATVRGEAARLAGLVEGRDAEALRAIGAAVESARYAGPGQTVPLPPPGQVNAALAALRATLRRRSGRVRGAVATALPRSVFARSGARAGSRPAPRRQH